MIDVEVLQKFDQICKEFDSAAAAADRATEEMEDLFSKSGVADRQTILMALADMSSYMARETFKEIFATQLSDTQDLLWIPEYVVPKIGEVYEGLIADIEGAEENYEDFNRHQGNIREILIAYLTDSGLSVEEMVKLLGNDKPNCKTLILEAVSDRIDFLWSTKS